MAATTLVEIRAKVAAAIAGLSGWRESPYPYPIFPSESGIDGHLSFAVGLTGSDPLSEIESSRVLRPVAGLHTSRLSVRWLCRLRVDNGVADYDAALASVLSLRAALERLAAGTSSGPPGGRVLLSLGSLTGPALAVGAVASASGGALSVISEQAVTVMHQLSTSEA